MTASFIPPLGETAFTSSTSEFIHLQICVNEAGGATLYINCGEPIPAAGITLPPVDISGNTILFLANDSFGSNPSTRYTVHFTAAIAVMMAISVFFPIYRGQYCNCTLPGATVGKKLTSFRHSAMPCRWTVISHRHSKPGRYRC